MPRFEYKKRPEIRVCSLCMIPQAISAFYSITFHGRNVCNGCHDSFKPAIRPPVQKPTDCCIYCGDFYQCRDHIIPVAWNCVYRTYRPNETVLCCSECNGYLSDRPLFSITDRAQYLIDAYKRHADKELATPSWSPDELNALGYSLQDIVRNSLYRKDLYGRKLANLALSGSGSPVIPIHQ